MKQRNLSETDIHVHGEHQLEDELGSKCPLSYISVSQKKKNTVYEHNAVLNRMDESTQVPKFGLLFFFPLTQQLRDIHSAPARAVFHQKSCRSVWICVSVFTELQSAC